MNSLKNKSHDVETIGFNDYFWCFGIYDDYAVGIKRATEIELSNEKIRK